MTEKTKRITNKFYLEFLEKGTITKIEVEHIKKASENIKGEYSKMYKAFLYISYYTGARPVELLSMRSNDVNKQGQHLIINVAAAKNGLPRQIYLSFKNDFVKDIYEYSRGLMPNMLMFWKLRGQYKRTRLTKKGVVKEYTELSRPLRYHFEKWFKNILSETDTPVPYHLRHNRFTKMAEGGASSEDIRLIKGAKSYNSVTPYLHLSSDKAKKLSKIIK